MIFSKTVCKKLAKDVADIAIHHEKREGKAPQRLDILLRFDIHNSCLLKSIELMENNIEYPLEIATLCSRAGLSVRQIRRLFRRHLGNSLKVYYKNIRLSHAQDLVKHTAMSVREIALATGFVNPAHFTKAYQSRYRSSPSKQCKAGQSHA